MRVFVSIFMAIFFSACVGVKLEQLKQENIEENLFQEFNASATWWKIYNNHKLNNFVEKLIENNKDLNVARNNLLSTLARYDLLKLDFYPTLSGDFGVGIRKNLNNSNEETSYSNGIMLNYELNLYGQISDRVSSANFLAKASWYELEKLRLDIINTGLNSIFEYIYFNDVDKLLNKHLQNLEQMLVIYTAKLDYGKVEYIDFLNIKKSILNTKQNIILNSQNKEMAYKNLKDLLGNKNIEILDEILKFKLEDFELNALNFDIDLKMLAYTPSVLTSYNLLKSSYKDYSNIQKSILPNVKIRANLDGNSDKIDDSFKILFLNGNVSLNLPFLDFARVKQNVKISEYEYNNRLLEYKDNLQKVINEFKLCYENDKYFYTLLENTKNIYDNQANISNIYYQKYQLGRSELKDYLDSDTLLISAAQELIRARLSLLKNINLYHSIVLISK